MAADNIADDCPEEVDAVAALLLLLAMEEEAVVAFAAAG